ncbi:ABC-F family ATP-binding cassette domain-containing protein [Consotaella aegiceratis]|uniref:ABC-F family ATP-binding cassette domain-containing protein n=1 Tax=Consotaella aegiceratis TaxID=3097961 RepID=UPI002F3F1C08
MSLISLDKLGITLGTPLFSDLNLAIQKGDRLGVVAANGRGKTTLLRCLAGQIAPSDGVLRAARNTRVALMEQEPDTRLLGLTLQQAVLEGLPPETREWEAWRADALLDELAVPQDLRDRPLAALSGGWQRTALLATAALREPDVLLMDEPTNHLDLARIGQVQRWIGGLPKEMAVVVASHDRAFLDAVSTRTLFLRTERSVDFALPYSPARASLDEWDAATARRHATDIQRAAQLRRQAAKLHNIGVNSGSGLLTVKTRQLKDRAERIESAARPAYREATAGRIRLADSGSEAKVVLTLDDARVATPDGRALFATGQRWIQPGDRIVLLGANGSGKSLFLDQVARSVRGEACEGLRCGPSVVPGICDQSLSHLRPEQTLARAIGDRFALGDQRIRTLLAGAGFPVERQGQTIAGLSGGQRARLAMLILRLEAPNFYVLDEPTNHLDIEGQEDLEAELLRGEAACLVVSHDRRFVETIGNRFWQIERRRLTEVDSPAAFFAAAMGGET